MDVQIDPQTGDYSGQRITSLANAVYLRLMTPLGSYWADITIGSRLHELRRMKDLPRILTLARQYSEQALEPLIRDGRARRVAVEATSLQPGVCLLTVEVDDQSGNRFTFNHHIKVI